MSICGIWNYQAMSFWCKFWRFKVSEYIFNLVSDTDTILTVIDLWLPNGAPSIFYSRYSVSQAVRSLVIYCSTSIMKLWHCERGTNLLIKGISGCISILSGYIRRNSPWRHGLIHTVSIISLLLRCRQSRIVGSNVVILTTLPLLSRAPFF